MRRHAVLIVVLLLLAGSAAHLLYQARGRSPAVEIVERDPARPTRPSESRSTTAERPAAEASSAAPSRPARLERAQRAELLAAIRQRLAARGASSSATKSASAGGSAAPASQPTATLDREYIQGRMREIIPLVQECFESALKEGSADGALRVRFSIVGDEELGGVIEDSEVLDETPLAKNATLAECVQETMYAMRLEAPTNGGRVEVRYPFIFRSRQESPGGKDRPAQP